MFLSQLVVNVGDNPNRVRPGLNWVRNPYHVHQRLAMAFPSPKQLAADPFFIEPFSKERFFGDGNEAHVHVKRDGRRGFLFRIEAVQPPVILVQSAEEPRWDYAFANANYLLARPPQIREFQPQFGAGQLWRFRLRANPTVKRQEKRHGLTTEDEQRAWLTRKGAAGGFEVSAVEVVPEGQDRAWRRSHPEAMAFLAVRFEGTLRVTDAASFLDAFQHGIGSGKGLGFGLLSLAKVPS